MTRHRLDVCVQFNCMCRKKQKREERSNSETSAEEAEAKAEAEEAANNDKTKCDPTSRHSL